MFKLFYMTSYHLLIIEYGCGSQKCKLRLIRFGSKPPVKIPKLSPMPLVRLEANATNAVEANSRKSGSVSHKIRQHSVHVKSISLAGITENSAD